MSMFKRFWNKDQPVPTLEEAMGVHRSGDLAAAMRAYSAILANEPGNANAQQLLGVVALQQGDFSTAERHIRAALVVMGDFPSAHLNLGLALRGLGQVRPAADAFQAAVALQPDLVDAWSHLGTTAFELGEHERAVNAFSSAVRLRPADVQAYLNLGAAQLAQGEAELARMQFMKASELDPSNAAAIVQAAVASFQLQRFAESEQWLVQALRLEPENADAHYQLGQVAEKLGNPVAAMAEYKSALASRPTFAEAHYAIGLLHWEQGASAQAIACYEQALASKPEYPEARWASAMTEIAIVRDATSSQQVGLQAFGRKLAELDQWFDARRTPAGWRCVGTLQPYFIVYYEQNHIEALSRYGDLCARLMAARERRRPALAKLTSAARTPNGKMRIGIVSAQLRNHSIWHALIKGWYAAIDPQRFELYSYCLSDVSDGETAFARKHSQRFVQIDPANANDLDFWMDSVRNDDLDVLLYPEIGLNGLSLQLASTRLAPVQATTWGQPETSGLPTLDYYFSAAAFEPLEAAANYRERLVALPSAGTWYEPLALAPLPPDWTAMDIDPTRPIVLCPGTPFKYAPEHDDVFGDILQRSPTCQLVFFGYETKGLTATLRARLEQTFARRGLDYRGCVRFVPWLEHARYYGLMQHATLLLDTIGFSGYNTAIQAIECGLPVVAWEGRFMRGQLASGILKVMGMDALVAHSREQFVACVAALCNDPAALTAARAKVLASRDVLFRDTAPIRALEQFIEKVVTERRPTGAVAANDAPQR